MFEIILTAVILLVGVYHYKYVYLPDNKIKYQLKQAALPKDCSNAQDDDYVLLMSAITKCKTIAQFNNCLDGINIFQQKYGESITGKIDTTNLVNFYLVKEKQSCR